MFCSKECMTMGRRFHQFECQVIDIKKEDESSVFQVKPDLLLNFS